MKLAYSLAPQYNNQKRVNPPPSIHIPNAPKIPGNYLEPFGRMIKRKTTQERNAHDQEFV
jgi:hypothetical protein